MQLDLTIGSNFCECETVPVSVVLDIDDTCHVVQGHDQLSLFNGQYARPEAMAWCEANGVDYVFGWPGSKPHPRRSTRSADPVRTARAVCGKPIERLYAETRHKAKSWNRELNGLGLRQSLLRTRPDGEPIKLHMTRLA